MKHYHAEITDAKTKKDREVYGTYDEKSKTTEDVKRELREWCAKWGHTLHEETYYEDGYTNVPGFVEACLNDIAGLKR
jgi:hypothetical protein